MPDIERTAAGLQAVIPGCGQGLLDFYRAPSGTVTVGGITVHIWGLDAEKLNEPYGELAKRGLRAIMLTCYAQGIYSANSVMAECVLVAQFVLDG